MAEDIVMALCAKIAEKTAALVEEVVPDYFNDEDERLQYRMRVTLAIADCHNHHPLRLEDMAGEKAHNPSLVHDVQGILRHWSVAERKFGDCFEPRYSA